MKHAYFNSEKEAQGWFEKQTGEMTHEIREEYVKAAMRREEKQPDLC